MSTESQHTDAGASLAEAINEIRITEPNFYARVGRWIACLLGAYEGARGIDACPQLRDAIAMVQRDIDLTRDSHEYIARRLSALTVDLDDAAWTCVRSTDLETVAHGIKLAEQYGLDMGCVDADDLADLRADYDRDKRIDDRLTGDDGTVL